MHSISKDIKIEMAHRLPNHEGRCRKLHGHSWGIEIFARGELQTTGPAEGMVCDLADLKRALLTIERMFDHALCIWVGDPIGIDLLGSRGGDSAWDDATEAARSEGCGVFIDEDHQIIFVPFMPTSENLATFWFNMVRKIVPQVYKIEVKETCTSKAIYELH